MFIFSTFLCALALISDVILVRIGGPLWLGITITAWGAGSENLPIRLAIWFRCAAAQQYDPGAGGRTAVAFVAGHNNHRLERRRGGLHCVIFHCFCLCKPVTFAFHPPCSCPAT